MVGPLAAAHHGGMATSTPPEGAAGAAQGTVPPPRRLYRRTDERVLGGVAAGIADYLGVDVTVVRLAVVLLAFAGPGVIAYVAAWVLVPAAPPGTPRNAPPARPAVSGPAGVLGAILVAVGVVALLRKVFWWDAHLLFPLALLAIGAVLLLRPGLDPSSPPPVGTPEPAAAPGPPGEAASSEALEGLSPAPPGVADELTAAGPPAVAAPPPGAASAGVTGAVPGRSSLGALVAGLALVVAGLAWVLAASGVMDLSAGDVLATALVVVGGGLVVGAWWGSARWLIALAVPLALALGVASLAGVPFRDGFGQRTFLPRSADEVRDEYRLGAGELLVDLSDVDVGPERTVRVRASVGMGSLRVVVPAAVAVDASGRVRLGQIRFPNGVGADGFGAEQRWSEKGATGAGRFELDLRVGMGEVAVDRG